MEVLGRADLGLLHKLPSQVQQNDRSRLKMKATKWFCARRASFADTSLVKDVGKRAKGANRMPFGEVSKVLEDERVVCVKGVVVKAMMTDGSQGQEFFV